MASCTKINVKGKCVLTSKCPSFILAMAVASLRAVFWTCPMFFSGTKNSWWMSSIRPAEGAACCGCCWTAAWAACSVEAAAAAVVVVVEDEDDWEKDPEAPEIFHFSKFCLKSSFFTQTLQLKAVGCHNFFQLLTWVQHWFVFHIAAIQLHNSPIYDVY